MTMTTDLAALSAAATQGEWRVETGHIQRDSGGIRYWQISDGQDAITCNQFCYAGFKPEVNEANAALIVGLVNAYRTGKLVQIDREGMRERVAGAISTCPPMSSKYPQESLPMADAAIAAILGGEHDRAV